MQTSLPKFQSESKDVGMLQSMWASVIEPFLKKPQNASLILREVELSVGSTLVPTKLDKRLQGWKIVRQRSGASIYDDQDNNPDAATSLLLVSDAAVVVDIEVF